MATFVQLACGYQATQTATFASRGHLMATLVGGQPTMPTPPSARVTTGLSTSLRPPASTSASLSAISPSVAADSEWGARTNSSASPSSTTALTGLCISPETGAAAANGEVFGPSAVCCDLERSLRADPLTGSTICGCGICDSTTRLTALGGYPPRLSEASSGIGVGVAVNVFGSPYSPNGQNAPYATIAVDPATPFYSSLNPPYVLKDNCSGNATWTNTALQPTGYYTYDPSFGACGYGAGYDLAARRKNAARESTATLKAWLNEHKKNPYPTKGEKIMLAIITKMTLTQVSTWFANARRRLKKENKMTWQPKSRGTGDSEDAEDAEDEEGLVGQEAGGDRDEDPMPKGLEYDAAGRRGAGVVGGPGGSVMGSKVAAEPTPSPTARTPPKDVRQFLNTPAQGVPHAQSLYSTASSQLYEPESRTPPLHDSSSLLMSVHPRPLSTHSLDRQ